MKNEVKKAKRVLTPAQIKARKDRRAARKAKASKGKAKK